MGWDKGSVLRAMILGSVLSVGFLGTLFAAENVGGEAKIIGETFKALARAYVLTADIAQLKDKAVQRIESMKEARFQRKYADVYRIARQLPSRIRSKDGITPEMTKLRAIRIVRSLDKKMLYEMIDNIPDPVIAQEFHEHTAKNADGPEGGDLFSRVSRTWGELVKKINKSLASEKQQILPAR